MVINKLLGSILLITSTAIGAAMIALPVSSASISFVPSSVLMCLCWLLMLYSALLILEVNLWFEPGANMVSMAENTLGSSGKLVAWSAYLLLLYCLLTAYLSSMNEIILHSPFQLTETLPSWAGLCLLIMLFGIILYLGTRTIDMINRVLIFGLLIAYVILTTAIAPHIDPNNLAHLSFHHFYFAIPIMITAFGFHIVIPSIRTYLNHQPEHIVTAIVIGSLIPLVMYIGWDFIILGAVPDTQLADIWFNGQPATQLPLALDKLIHSHAISAGASLFAFFAIATSFIGVSLSLFDFLCDGLHIAKTRLGRITTAGLTFLPPMVFNLFYPQAFLAALGYASIFVAILLGLLPIAMTWHGRYYQTFPQQYRAPGGQAALSIAGLCFVGVIVLELLPH